MAVMTLKPEKGLIHLKTLLAVNVMGKVIPVVIYG